MFENKLKTKLVAGETVIGTMNDEIHDPLLMPLLNRCGFDFVIHDYEHGTFALNDMVQFAQAAKSTNLTVMARPPGFDYISIAKLWDAGAQGLMVPRVETPEQVHQIIQFSKYPPMGERGYGPRGIITNYESIQMKEKVNIINQNTLIIIQIEKKLAIENIESIIVPAEIDGVIVGPYDLSLSLGIPEEFTNPLFVKSIEKVIQACKKRGIPSGIHASNMKDLLMWKEKGMRLLMCGSTFKFIQEAGSDIVKKIHIQ